MNGLEHGARWRLTLVAVLAALTVACGGSGGGGGGGGATPSAGATLTGDYYPVNSGDRRTWRTVGGVVDGSLRHELVGESVRLAAGTALVVRGAEGVTDYLQRTDTAVTSLPGPTSDALTIAVGAYDIVRFGVAVGQASVLIDRTVSVDVDADGRADSVTLRVESTFVGLEAVTTPAGSFGDAAHLRTVVSTTVRLAGAGAPVTVTLTADDWLALGVGPVRSTSTTTAADGSPPQTDVEELLAYGVGGRRSETTPPALLSSTPAADAPYGNSQPVTLVFSERLDPLSLDGTTGLRLLDAAGQPVAADRRVDDSGTQITFWPSSVLPDGRYTLQSGGSVTDLAGNLLPTAPRAFFVDTRGPRIVASTPSEGATDAALTGSLVLTFDEPLVPAAGSMVQLRLSLFPNPEVVLLPATVSGNTVTAPLITPLLRNREYMVQLASPITDALGNPPFISGSTLRFRTDPGALARPDATLPGADVAVVRLADWNGDGLQDLVFGAQQIGSSVHFIAVRLALTGGGFAPAQRLHSFPEFFGCGLADVAVLDADGDGRRDLVAYSDCAVPRLVVLLQQADGSFVTERPALDVTSQQLGAMDIDGDGRDELVLAQPGGLRFLQRDAGGTWQQKAVIGAGSFINAWQFADLDGDGRADLVWVQINADNSGYEVAWARRTGAGFESAQARALPLAVTAPPRLAVGDVNGDGRADIILALSPSSGAERMAILSQDATGQFGDDRLLATTYSPTVLAVADMDGDGRPDLVVGHATGSGLGVYLQGSDGRLQDERLFEVTYGNYNFARSLALADVDGNGRLDVVLANDVILSRLAAGVAWPLQTARQATAATLQAPVPAAGAARRSGATSWPQMNIFCSRPSLPMWAPRPRCTSSPRSITSDCVACRGRAATPVFQAAHARVAARGAL